MILFAPQTRLSTYVAMVSGIHIAIFLLLMLFGSLSGIEFGIDTKKLNIIQSSIKVDVVAMPTFTQKELRVMQQASQAAAEVEKSKASDNGDEETALLEKTNFMDKLKKISQRKVEYKNSRKKKTKPKSKNQFDTNKIDKLVLAGNKLSKGVAISGTVNSEDLSLLRQYMEKIPDIVRPFWKLPSYLQGKDYRCRVRIYIAKNGKILNKKVIEGSGEEQFDSRAIKALEQVNLPTPDPSITSELLKGVVVLGFPL